MASAIALENFRSISRMLHLQLNGTLKQHLTKVQLEKQWYSFYSELQYRRRRKRSLEMKLIDAEAVLNKLCRRTGTLKQVRRCSCARCSFEKRTLNRLGDMVADGAEAVMMVENICNMYYHLWNTTKCNLGVSPLPDKARKIKTAKNCNQHRQTTLKKTHF